MDSSKNSILSLPISVDGCRMSCYYDVKSKAIYIGATSARDITKKSLEGIIPLTINGSTAYPLKDVVEHMKPKMLKHFTLHCFKKIMEGASQESVKRPGERKLSSFDRLILQAMEEQGE